MNFRCAICGADSGVETLYRNIKKLEDIGWEMNYAYPVRTYCPKCKLHAYDYKEGSQ